jgi:hypothetical protein
MIKYAVAYFSLHTGTLTISFVEAEDRIAAALTILPEAFSEGYEYQKFSTLQSDVMDCDAWVEVSEIPT